MKGSFGLCKIKANAKVWKGGLQWPHSPALERSEKRVPTKVLFYETLLSATAIVAPTSLQKRVTGILVASFSDDSARDSPREFL